MSERSGWSLRRRLLAWLLGPVLLVSAGLLLDAYRGARQAADRAYDALIAASALAIADRVVGAEAGLDVDLPYVALEMLRTPAEDRVFYGITGPGGEFVTGYRDIPLPSGGELPQGYDPIFYDAQYRGQTVRVALLTRPVVSRGFSGRYSVQVAQTRGERELLARSLALGTAGRLLALILLVALITWLGIRLGLEPLERLRREVRRRSTQDLSPLQVEVPREVRELVGAIDSLMARLDRSLRIMEQFISDAAHQLRGPLAALHTQVEVALRESDPDLLRRAVASLQATTWRTSRLARQLLSQARASSETAAGRRSPVDLAELAAEVTREHVPAALVKQIDLGYEGASSAAISADPVLLRELLKNLIDNALRYCPERATVTVRVLEGSTLARVVMEVEDDGPGIPASERQRVFERFYRIEGRTEEGSGLGLSIVSEVAEGFGGRVSLHQSRSGGLLVRVVFRVGPDAAPEARPASA